LNQYEITPKPLISLDVYETFVHDVNNSKLLADVRRHGHLVGMDCEANGVVSRGFIQYEDIVVPITNETAKLERSVLSVIQQITGGRKYKIQDTWAVDLEFNQSVIPHTHKSNLHLHPLEYYSFCYYPEVPENSAQLTFYANYCDQMTNMVTIQPEVGKLVIFNAFVMHFTSRHKGSTNRMVISGNLSPVNPTSYENADWDAYHDRPKVCEA